jgi:hypothetical protein
LSEKFWVFGTQLDPTTVQALERHEKLRSESERDREQKRHARRQRRDAEKARRQDATLHQRN